jgi:Transmembrane protein 43
MPITVTCPCGKTLRVADDAAGKKVRCPACSAVNLVHADVEEGFVKPLDDPSRAAQAEPPRRRGRRVHRVEGDWQVGDEVLAPDSPDCLSVATIRELAPNKAWVEFAHNNYAGWVFLHTLQNVGGLQLDQEVKCYDPGGTIRDGKILQVQGDNVHVAIGINLGPDQPIMWTEEQAQFDISAIGVPCQATSPGAKPDEEFSFYENLKVGDRVWAPWERHNLYPGTISAIKNHEVHVHFDNGNRGWVLVGQTFPFVGYVGEYVTVCKGAGWNGTIAANHGRRIQVTSEQNGKTYSVRPHHLAKRMVIPLGPNARPTRFAGGLLLKVMSMTLGVVLILVAAAAVYFFEDYARRQSATLAEGSAACLSAAADRIDPAHEGKLVHVAGDALSDETLTDDLFNMKFSAKALKLVRTVEIYQWTEHSKKEKDKTVYTHKGEWVKDPVSSASFHEDVNGKKHVNPVSPKPDNAVLRPRQVKLGAYRLTDEQVDRIGKGEKLIVPDAAVANPPEILKKKVKVLEGVVYVAMYPDTDPTSPNAGDVRITYTLIPPPQPVTIVAKQTKDSFAPWVSSSGNNTLDELRPGIFTREQMFEKAEESHKLVKLVLRIGSGIVLVLGLYLLLVHWWLWRKMFPRGVLQAI